MEKVRFKLVSRTSLRLGSESVRLSRPAAVWADDRGLGSNLAQAAAAATSNNAGEIILQILRIYLKT